MGEAILNDDVLAEIFLRLSGECMFRCKSLSKQWKHYLSSPLFRHKYLSRRRELKSERILLLGFFRTSSYSTAPAPFHPLVSQGKFIETSNCIEKSGVFVACSNGLILVRASNSYPENNTYHVCNPFTNKSIQLPKPNTISTQLPGTEIINFHYREEDDGSACFRVVRVYPPENEQLPSSLLSIECYSSQTGMWKESTLTTPEPFQISYPTMSSRSCNSDMSYWLTAGNNYPHRIIAYDTKGSQDSLWLIELPQPEKTGKDVTVSESKQGLLMCAIHNYGESLLTVTILREKLQNYSYNKVVPRSEWVIVVADLSLGQYPNSYIDLFPEKSEWILVRGENVVFWVSPITREILPAAQAPCDYDYPFPYLLWNWPWPPSMP